MSRAPRATPIWARLLLAGASLLVPAPVRRAWRRQWEAEVVHYARRHGGVALARFTAGAWAHALSLRWGRVRGVDVSGALRTSARSLARRPGFTLLSVLTLGVGIGAAVAVFSLAEAALFRPLPLPGGDRLVRLFTTDPVRGFDHVSVSWPDFVDWTARADLFASASVYASTSRDLAGEGDPVRLDGVAVHDRFFETLRASAEVGRLLGEGDQDPASEAAVVLSDAVWRRIFAADRGVLGRTVRLDGEPFTVVGVAPPAATWPVDADFWVPLRLGGALPAETARRTNHAWQVIARLRPGVPLAVADAHVAAVARAWYTTHDTGYGDDAIEGTVVPLAASRSGSEGRLLFAGMGVAVLLVLLIACINQSSLLLAHGLARGRELSLRAALGAGRARLFALLLGESLLLALAGGVLGVVLARVAVRVVVAHAPLDFPTLGAVGLDLPLLLGALTISLAASLLAGVLPAARASRASVAAALREGGRQASAGRSGTRLRRVLVAVELALSAVLLTTAGYAIRTFRLQLSADPGFGAEHALVFSVRLPAARYAEAALVRQYFDAAVDRLEAIPGVVAAGVTSRLPLGASRGALYRVFLAEGTPEPPAGEEVGATWVSADASFFTALGVAPTRGRVFTRDDGADALPVMVVSASFARRVARAGPEGDVLGLRVRSWRDENLLRTVVGVVPDIQLDGLAGKPQPAVYVPAAQDARRSASFLVRTVSEPGDLVAAVRAALSEVDSDVALADLSTLRAAHRARLGGVRFVMALFGLFGTLALLLAAVGVYGLVAHAVSLRRAEIGIRVALGATERGVQRRLVGEGLFLAAVGIGVGLAVSLVLARVAGSLVFGLSWMDARTLVGVAALLGGVTVLACWLPARRVLRVDPGEALRRA